MTYKGFELRTVTMFGRIHWYGVKGIKATGNYSSQAALMEAIRTSGAAVTQVPKKEDF